MKSFAHQHRGLSWVTGLNSRDSWSTSTSVKICDGIRLSRLSLCEHLLLTLLLLDLLLAFVLLVLQLVLLLLLLFIYSIGLFRRLHSAGIFMEQLEDLISALICTLLF